MSGLTLVFFKCSNIEVVKACVTSISSLTLGGVTWCENDTAIYFVVKIGFPREEIILISKLFPDDVIFCRYNFEYGNCVAEDHIEVYRDGNSIAVDIEPSYHCDNSTAKLIAEDGDAIWHKIYSFFRRLDTTEKDRDGNLFLNWFEEEVCYRFKYSGQNSNAYKVDATKCRHSIDLKVYENLGEDNWREITCPETIECPF